jgi:hypothetical protein
MIKNNSAGVSYETSDGVTFMEHHFAKAHADKNGLKIKQIKKPIKPVKNGTK